MQHYGQEIGSPSVSPRRRTRAEKFDMVLRYSANFGMLLAQIAGKPSKLQWIGLSVNLVNTGRDIYRDLRPQQDAWEVLRTALPEDDGLSISSAAYQQLAEAPTNGRRLGGDQLLEAYSGSYLGLPAWWLTPPLDSKPGAPAPRPDIKILFIHKSDQEGFRAQAEKRLHLLYGACAQVRSSAISKVESIPMSALVSTAFLTEFQTRVQAFQQHGFKRSYLLDGLPGTGKTTIARQVAAATGQPTVHFIHTDEGLHVTTRSDSQSSTVNTTVGHFGYGLEFIRLYKPGVIVFDDIDRLNRYEQYALLGFLERMHDAGTLIATSNNKAHLDPALRRPGRFDEVIDIPALDSLAVEALLGPDKHVADQMLGWPIAYIVEWKQRRQVLGERAFSEIPEMQTRIANAADDAAASDVTKWKMP